MRISESLVYTNMGYIYNKLGDYDKAFGKLPKGA